MLASTTLRRRSTAGGRGSVRAVACARSCEVCACPGAGGDDHGGCEHAREGHRRTDKHDNKIACSTHEFQS
eukprot:7201466-Prymnesium_polylepis.2